MKIEKFFNWILDNLLNYPDISVNTVKMFADKLYCCLSRKEKERWKLKYQLISEFTLKQISIDSFIQETITDNLVNELNKLKNDENNGMGSMENDK